MTRQTRALDVARAAPVAPDPVLPRRVAAVVSAPAKRSLSVVKALEWAFAVEQVSIEFDELNPDAYTVGCDPIYRMMRQAELGCRVDGGGVTPRADDAEVIASIVARLPDGYGGKGVALQVAHYARACSAPDPMVGAAPQVVPCGWFTNRHGTTAKTEVYGQSKVLSRGRTVIYDWVGCPVTYAPSAAQIASARRGYLDWYGALIHLRYELATCGLATIDITTAMPPMTPWRKDS